MLCLAPADRQPCSEHQRAAFRRLPRRSMYPWIPPTCQILAISRAYRAASICRHCDVRPEGGQRISHEDNVAVMEVRGLGDHSVDFGHRGASLSWRPALPPAPASGR